jgi:hypothetical protein
VNVSLERLVATMSGCSTWHSSEHAHASLYNLFFMRIGAKREKSCE